MNAHDICRKKLHEIALSIPDMGPVSKASIHDENGVVGFLGLALHGADQDFRIGITKKQQEAIRRKFYEYADIGFCLANNIKLSDVLQRVNGLIASYSGAYDICDDFGRISNFMFDTRKMVFSEIFKKLGVDVNVLSVEKKKFLQVEF